MNEQMEESEASILHTYNRFPVVFEKGEVVTSMIPKEGISGFCGRYRSKCPGLSLSGL